MFCYKIGQLSATPKPQVDHSFLSKKQILERALSKCWFAEGDRIKFKKPKRNPWYGTITHIERDWEKVTWTQGNLCPNFITLSMEKGQNEKVKTSAKKIILVLSGANKNAGHISNSS